MWLRIVVSLLFIATFLVRCKGQEVQVMFLPQDVNFFEFLPVQLSITFTPREIQIPFTLIVETFDLSPFEARAGVDYLPLRRNITLSESQVTADIAVDIIQDNITERIEAFGVRILIPVETQQLHVVLGNQSEMIIRIIDDDYCISDIYFCGELEIIVFTNTTINELNNKTIQLFFYPSQDDVSFRCRINAQPFVTNCTSPHIFANVDAYETVTVTVEGTLQAIPTPQTTVVNKNVLIAMGGLQVVGIGAMAARLQATKNATYKCRLNDEELANCVDGQVFHNLTAGSYTLFVKATATENMYEVANDEFGAVILTVGLNANTGEAIAACFGRQQIHCDDENDHNCEYIATWRTRGDRVEFTLVAQTQGWVGIGFLTDRKILRGDFIVGTAINDTAFFVDDRYVEYGRQPSQDAVHNVDNTFASFVNVVTTVQFSRDKITDDSDGDASLDVCHFLLFAWSGNTNVTVGVIQFDGSQNQVVSDTLICFPSPSLCPERFDCGDPGTPDNGDRNFTDTLEGSIVTYSCDDGFEIVGNQTQTCELTPNGVFWSYTRPQCIAVSSSDDSVSAAAGASGAVAGTLLLIIVVIITVTILYKKKKRSSKADNIQDGMISIKFSDPQQSDPSSHQSQHKIETELYTSPSTRRKSDTKRDEKVEDGEDTDNYVNPYPNRLSENDEYLKMEVSWL